MRPYCLRVGYQRAEVCFRRHGQRRVFIGLGMGKAAELEIIVRDSGVGLPYEFDYRQDTSLGLRLVHAFVQQLRGTMEIIGGAGPNLRYVLLRQQRI